MNSGKYDLVADKKKEFNKPSPAAYLKARDASDRGNLKLLDEFIAGGFKQIQSGRVGDKNSEAAFK